MALVTVLISNAESHSEWCYCLRCSVCVLAYELAFNVYMAFGCSFSVAQCEQEASAAAAAAPAASKQFVICFFDSLPCVPCFPLNAACVPMYLCTRACTWPIDTPARYYVVLSTRALSSRIALTINRLKHNVLPYYRMCDSYNCVIVCVIIWFRWAMYFWLEPAILNTHAAHQTAGHIWCVAEKV